MQKYIDIITIGFAGYFTGLSLSDINERLQMIVLILTIAGLIWKTFKSEKK